MSRGPKAHIIPRITIDDETLNEVEDHTMQYTTLTREDVKAWDKEAWALIDEAQKAGWVFATSSRGHAIGRAPDGTTTMSVGKNTNGRAGANSRAKFDRWRKQVEATFERSRNITTMGDAAKALGLPAEHVEKISANHRAKLRQGLHDHLETMRLGADAPNVPDAFYTICERMLDTDEMVDTIGRLVNEGAGMPKLYTRDLDQPDLGPEYLNDKSRAWRVQWVAVHPTTKAVLGWGGPQMTEQGATDLMTTVTERSHDGMLASATVVTPRGECPVCHASFEDVTAHLARTHPEHTKCPECDGWFKPGLGMQSHHRSAHEPAVPCEICGKPCRPGPGYAAHMRSHAAHGQARPNAGVNRAAEQAHAQRVLDVANEDAADLPKPAEITKPAEISGSTWQQLDPPGGPVEALMSVLAELERLRALNADDLARRLAAMTDERDAAIKRAEEAEASLALIREHLGVTS